MKTNNWINAKTRKPKCNKEFGESNYVLGFEQNQQVVCWYNKNDKTWHVGHYKADSLPIEVTHWQPLPPPPTE